MSRTLPTLWFRIQKCMKQWTTSVLYSNASHTVCFELTVLWICLSNERFSFWISIGIKKKNTNQTVQFLSTSGPKLFYTFFLHVMFKSCNAHVKDQIPNLSFEKLIFIFKCVNNMRIKLHNWWSYLKNIQLVRWKLKLFLLQQISYSVEFLSWKTWLHTTRGLI